MDAWRQWSPANLTLSGRKSDAQHYLLLGLVLAVAVFLRAVGIQREALWSDESLTLLIARWSARDLLFSPVEFTPGLYYLLVKAFVPLDPTLLDTRLISLIAGSCTVLPLYGAGRVALSRRAGLVGAALIALSPPLVDYSQEGRPYALLVFLVSLAFLGFVWLGRRLAERRATLAPLTLFSCATGLSFYTHLESIFWIGPAVIMGRELTRRLGTSRDRRAYLVAAAALVALAVPEANRLWHRLPVGGFGWLQQESASGILSLMGEADLPAALWNGRWVRGSAASAYMIVAIAALIAWRLFTHRVELRERMKVDPAYALGTAVLCLAPLGVWSVGFFITPIAMPRTVLIGVPGFVAVLMLLVELERGRVLPAALMLLFTGGLAIGGTTRPKEPWTPVANYLQANVQPGDAILVCAEWKAPSLLHALHDRVSAPLFFPITDRMARIPAVGSQQHWTTVLFPILFKAPVDTVFGLDDFTKRPVASVPTPGRIWVVTSECRAPADSQVAYWLGEPASRPAIDLPSTQWYKGITVTLWTGRPQMRQFISL